ncbi:MAG TPA: hypothetical protein VJQ45_11940, partial [Ktedonobacterales bacterium]|nr:hypothetical protein [Ktedonobacterales bacterium]
MGTTMETVEIPAGYALRPPTQGDIPAIMALLAAHDIAQSGFADAYNGWLVGGFGTILHTRDGGKTW